MDRFVRLPIVFQRDVDFSQGYGLTETSPLATVNPLNSKEYKTVGFALPNMQMRIVDDKMNNLGPNEVSKFNYILKCKDYIVY